MSDILFLDTNSLVYAWNAGGAALLDKYAAYARGSGFELTITDIVEREILNGPKSVEITAWLRENSVKIETSAESQKYDKYLRDLEAGYPTDYNTTNAGDRSMSEIAGKAKAAGQGVKVFSDDSWFSNKQELRKFGLNTDVGLTNFQILNNMAISGQISPEDFERFKAGFINQPPVGNSPRLNRFLTAAELSEVLKGGSLSNAILPKLGTGLKVVGVAGLIYDIGTSSAQAAEAANAGNKDEAGNIMARLAARLYFGFEAGAGGAMLGAAAGAPGGLTAAAGAIIGGIAGGIVGVIVGDVVADTIWKWADDAIASLTGSNIEEQPASTPQLDTPEILTAAGTVYQNLIASGLSDARAQSILASLAAEFSRRDALGHPIAADELVKEITGSVLNNQAVPETGEDGLIVTNLIGTTSSATTFVDSDGAFKESIVRADGTSEESRYNKKGQLVQKVDTNPSGTIVRTYNTYGQKTREISYATNGNRIYENEYIGDIFTKKHYNNLTGFIEKKVEHIGEYVGEVYLYNVDAENGRILSAYIYEDDELVGEMNASYDASGKLIREEYSYGGEIWREIFYSYDLNTGKLTSTQEYEEGQLSNELFYDGETGHLVHMKNYIQGALTSESNYDRLTGELLPTLPSSNTQDPSVSPKISLVYDDAGQRIGYTVERIVASGIKWIQEYDSSDRKVSEKRTLLDGTTIETKIRSTGSTKITQANGNTILELPYEEKLSEIVTSPDGTITKTTFLLEQRVSETIETADGKTESRFDVSGRLLERTSVSPSGTVVTTYDPRTAQIIREQSYDLSDRLISFGIVDAQQYKKFSFSYSSDGTVAEIISDPGTASQTAIPFADFGVFWFWLADISNTSGDTRLVDTIAKSALKYIGTQFLSGFDALLGGHKGLLPEAGTIEFVDGGTMLLNYAGSKTVIKYDRASGKPLERRDYDGQSERLISVTKYNLNSDETVRWRTDRFIYRFDSSTNSFREDLEYILFRYNDQTFDVTYYDNDGKPASFRKYDSGGHLVSEQVLNESTPSPVVPGGITGPIKDPTGPLEFFAKDTIESRLGLTTEQIRALSAAEARGMLSHLRVEQYVPFLNMLGAGKIDQMFPGGGTSGHLGPVTSTAGQLSTSNGTITFVNGGVSQPTGLLSSEGFNAYLAALYRGVPNTGSSGSSSTPSPITLPRLNPVPVIPVTREPLAPIKQGVFVIGGPELNGWGIGYWDFGDGTYSVPVIYPAGNPPVTPPVILDLNNDGHIDLRPFNLLATGATGPRFDWNSDGTRDATAWVGPQDGFLAIDLGSDGNPGGDGVIDQAKELAFASWVDEDARSENNLLVTDLEGLRLIFDTNYDNVLDHRDARWNEFRVWQDANQNGVSDIGELKTMPEAGIKLINLMPTADGARAFADGSAITGTSSMEMTDGSQRLVGDVTLAYHPSSLGRSV